MPARIILFLLVGICTGAASLWFLDASELGRGYHGNPADAPVVLRAA